MRRRRRGFHIRRFPRFVQHAIAVFYQILVPLIVFQFIRTLIFPTSFDMLLLGLLVFIYLSRGFGWFRKK